MAFVLPPLPYAHDALEPVIDKETMGFHYDKHHQTYVDNLNKAVAAAGVEGQSFDELFAKMSTLPVAVRNNAGGVWNHTFFWDGLAPVGTGGAPSAELAAAIDADLGGYDKMRTDFIQAGVTQFGSGWAWIAKKDGKLVIMKTPNGENPLMHGASPILGCDVWEHSYYIDYRNRRPDYVKAFIENLVNWEYVAQMYDKAVG